MRQDGRFAKQDLATAGAPSPSCRTLHRCTDLARDQAFQRAAGSVLQHGGSAEYDVIRDLAGLCAILVDAPRSTIEAAQIDVTAGRGSCRESRLSQAMVCGVSNPICEMN